MRQRMEEGDEEGLASDLASGLAAGAATVAAAADSMADSVVDSAGQPGAEHVRFAQTLRRSIPAELYDAAHSSDSSYLLAVALILNHSGDELDRQLQLVGEQLGAERAEKTRQFYDRLAEIDARFRLPLLSIAFPALKRRPAPQLEFLAELAERLINVDGKIDLYEFCYYRILSTSLSLASSPSTRLAPKRARRRDVRTSAARLLTIMSEHGHPDADEREAAYRAGAELLGDWAMRDDVRPAGEVSVADLDRSLDALLALNGKSRRKLVSAICTVAGHDGHLAARRTGTDTRDLRHVRLSVTADPFRRCLGRTGQLTGSPCFNVNLARRGASKVYHVPVGESDYDHAFFQSDRIDHHPEPDCSHAGERRHA